MSPAAPWRPRPRAAGSRVNPACIALLAVALAGCASPRYVGSIGRDQVYANRGFGVLARLTQGDLLSRWAPADPDDLDAIPPALRPQRVREQLDVNGDGQLDVTETVVFYRPSLRLLSRTSSVAHMDLEVQLLGRNNAKVPLDAVMGLDLKRLAGTSTGARDAAFAHIERRTLTGEVEARVAEIRSVEAGARRWARLLVADVPEFRTEEGQTRRHIVRLTLWDTDLSDQDRADFDRVVQGLVLAPQGGPPGTGERW
jgi:hypothetical protein